VGVEISTSWWRATAMIENALLRGKSGKRKIQGDLRRGSGQRRRGTIYLSKQFNEKLRDRLENTSSPARAV